MLENHLNPDLSADIFDNKNKNKRCIPTQTKVIGKIVTSRFRLVATSQSSPSSLFFHICVQFVPLFFLFFSVLFQLQNIQTVIGDLN